jgi:monovalent cation/hydrogen antiporter
MGDYEHILDLTLGLLALLALLVLASRRLGVPYPILLVAGGLLIGFFPGLPRVTLAPELVFVVFLPPLLYQEAYFTSWRDFRANLRPISLLVFGLVLATTSAVAAVAHWAIPGLSWPTAFVLGAVVAPTDEVAVAPVVERLGVPRRIVTIVEGESLINDAVSLVVYRLAVAAVLRGVFSLPHAVLEFMLMSVGGVVIGLTAGWLVAQVVHRINDPPVEIALSLVVPYAGYLPAERLGVSGVLAVVAMGMYLGRKGSELRAPLTRLQARVFWQMLVFLLNGVLFILVGLEFPRLLASLSGSPVLELAGEALLIGVTCILIRIIWVFPATYLPRLLSRRLRERDPAPPWTYPALLSWIGIRGGLSLAAALAIPLRLPDGSPFPQRDRILFLTWGVIFITLVLQGQTLPGLIRRLGLREDESLKRERDEARLRATEAALRRLDELAGEEWVLPEVAEHLRGHYERRLRRLRARSDGKPDERHEQWVNAYHRLQQELLDAEHRAVVRLRDEGAISDEVLHDIERDLDLDRVRLEAELEESDDDPPEG